MWAFKVAACRRCCARCAAAAERGVERPFRWPAPGAPAGVHLCGQRLAKQGRLMVTAAAASLAYLCGHAARRPTLPAASLSLQVHDSEIPAHREGSEFVLPPPFPPQFGANCRAHRHRDWDADSAASPNPICCAAAV